MSLNPFLEYLNLEKNYSKHTVLAYEKDVTAFFVFLKENYGEDDPIAVAYAQIRSWIVSLVDAGVSNQSVNRKVSSLKAYYKFLLKVGDVAISPLVKHKSLKVSKRVQIPFSEKEVGLVLQDLREMQDFVSLRDLLMVELLYGTGMRRAELIDLTLGSVDFSQKTLKVLGKRNKERLIPLLPGVISTLDRYLIERSRIAGEGSAESLIVTAKGLKVYSTLVYRVINRYFSEASDKFKTSPHILRHSFATHLLNQGADLNVVKELLGHASLASTQVYTHNSIKALKDVYSKAHPRTKK
ncbi:tyrosine-type recombinase/integrase [uncultured Dokdonia sp.]|uniref:tyrosine-type recombinase/integrase n=1 Tax=uncultured Dokdonia sp. TaxID=575653 RepID=UPI002608942C|nr:tyrosine-type recombinase/integrase [uncultured Dokdonia sp.]